MTFQSLKEIFMELLSNVMAESSLHARWLNTLSFLENCGARKLAAYEHPTLVKEEMLKHAAEEFRHAHLLKQQIHRLGAHFPVDYHPSTLVGGFCAYHYLHRLEVAVSRLVAENREVDRGTLSYLLITYAIEKRAEEVYTLYLDLLRRAKSPIRIYSILLEEKEHLSEITQELAVYREAEFLCNSACKLESEICQAWLKQCSSF